MLAGWASTSIAGGGVIELKQATSLATNNVADGLVSYAVLTAAVEVVAGDYWQVGTLVISPPTNRTIMLSNSYLFSGQKARFSTATNVSDHSLHLLIERIK